ncbi:MAG: hypothetical protein IPJ07_23210 [Acidobacteria bacterium]|nr:hypothetical protein [Acidobacteriota bacterium]
MSGIAINTSGSGSALLYRRLFSGHIQKAITWDAHLNVIDTLRSVGRLDEALKWAARALPCRRAVCQCHRAFLGQADPPQQDITRQRSLTSTELKARNRNVRRTELRTNPAEVTFPRKLLHRRSWEGLKKQ